MLKKIEWKQAIFATSTSLTSFYHCKSEHKLFGALVSGRHPVSILVCVFLTKHRFLLATITTCSTYQLNKTICVREHVSMLKLAFSLTEQLTWLKTLLLSQIAVAVNHKNAIIYLVPQARYSV